MRRKKYNHGLKMSCFCSLILRRLLVTMGVSVLGACSQIAIAPDEGEMAKVSRGIEWNAVSSSSTDARSATWQHRTFPGKQETQYRAGWQDGRHVVQGDSRGAASMLRRTLRVEPGALSKLRFSWKVPALIEGADLTQRHADDSPVRIVLAFDGDRSTFSAKNAMLSELALALTGEPLPYATLMYVWGTHSTPESVIINTRTDRIRKLVIESGSGRLGRWLDYERDIRADYEKAFGEAPGALVGVAIMTDSDNTRQKTKAWYGPVTLMGKPASPSMAAVPLIVSQTPEFAPVSLQD
ncbi:DUF3047 domain-containing protein [Polaromonas aquatica]|uniref:DUF3047 domain-containing protein n=1 Tax=Polaromonas aquatica TaxID=332657 RepID=UPI003D64EF32